MFKKINIIIDETNAYQKGSVILSFYKIIVLIIKTSYSSLSMFFTQPSPSVFDEDS